MKKQILGLLCCGFLLSVSVAEAYTWGAYHGSRAGSQNYKDNYSTNSSGTSNGHSYLNYGRRSTSGGSVSIPTHTTMHHYDDKGNSKIVQVKLNVRRPISGNFGKAINRRVLKRKSY